MEYSRYFLVLVKHVFNLLFLLLLYLDFTKFLIIDSWSKEEVNLQLSDD